MASTANMAKAVSKYFRGLSGATVVDFKAEGFKTDKVGESQSSGAGVTADSVLFKDGGVTCPTSTTGLGYSTGAGGAVTQSTNKGTGVTSNEICGTITTNNAALAANTEVAFTVTCAACQAVTYVPIVAIQSGGTSGEYKAFVSDVGAGSFDITLANMTAGSLSDAMLINYVVIPAVAA